MQIYIMDSDYEVMRKLELLINSYPKHKAKCFTNYQQVVEAVRKEPPDIVLIDIDSSNGLSAVKTIQLTSSETKIVIMSEEREKTSEYFELHVNGFLEKPIEEEKLKEQLLRAKHPLFARVKYGRERIVSL